MVWRVRSHFEPLWAQTVFKRSVCAPHRCSRAREVGVVKTLLETKPSGLHIRWEGSFHLLTPRPLRVGFRRHPVGSTGSPSRCTVTWLIFHFILLTIEKRKYRNLLYPSSVMSPAWVFGTATKPLNLSLVLRKDLKHGGEGCSTDRAWGAMAAKGLDPGSRENETSSKNIATFARIWIWMMDQAIVMDNVNSSDFDHCTVARSASVFPTWGSTRIDIFSIGRHPVFSLLPNALWETT